MKGPNGKKCSFDRFVIVVRTGSGPDKKSLETLTTLLNSTYEKWQNVKVFHINPRNLSKAPESKVNFAKLTENEFGLLEISEDVHHILDLLPEKNHFICDVIWILKDFNGESLDLDLYGALKRASLWHSASVSAFAESINVGQNDYLEDLRVEMSTISDLVGNMDEFIHSDLIWRGSLGFYDDSDKEYEDLTGFELIATENILNNCKTMSRCIKVIKSVDVRTIPKFYFQKSAIFRTSFMSNDSIAEKFWNNSDYFSDTNGIIVKLEYSSDTFDYGSSLKTTDWKKEILSGKLDMKSPPECLNFRRNVECLHLLISNKINRKVFGNRNGDEKFAVVLDGSIADNLKSFDEVQDCIKNKNNFNNSVSQLTLLNANGDKSIGKIKTFIADVEKSIFKALKEHHPESLNQENSEETYKIIRQRILKRLNLIMNKEHLEVQLESQNGDLQINDDEERKFLDFVEYHKSKMAEKKLLSNPKIGDFVILQAKELLKFFNPDGSALKIDETTEVLKPSATSSLATTTIIKGATTSTKNPSQMELGTEWPESMYLDVLGIDYNLSEISELKDRESVEITKIYVGSRETASTCHGQNEKPDIVNKPSQSQQPPKKDKPEMPAPPRRSPRKKLVPTRRVPQASTSSASSTSNKEDVYVVKLRNAVYNALGSRKIESTDALFRPCFKKLFEITKMYAGNKPPPGVRSTKDWLFRVANQNVDNVISLEQTLMG